MQAERTALLDGPREPILALGRALAVLVTGVSRDVEARNVAASLALTGATGRGDIAVGRRPSGRPRLAPPYPELGVSLSHRSGLMLVGFSPDGPVGTDLELDTSDLDPARLASDHFSPAEAMAVAGRPTPAARDLFLRLWVAKEAALKLTGRGVYDGLAEPDLSAGLDAMTADGGMVALSGGERLPPLRLTVCRLVCPMPVYCALAVCR